MRTREIAREQRRLWKLWLDILGMLQADNHA